MKDQKHMPADSCEGKTQNTAPAVSSSAAAERSHLVDSAARRHARRARASKVKGKVSLYLAESLVPQGADAELLRAARVGIKISSGGQVLAANIFELDSSDSGHRGEHPATAPAGLAGYTEGMLLGWQNGQLACGANVTQDPAAFTLDTSETARRPQNTLATLALGQTYRLDIYYYIEGTDPDSADYLHQDPGTLHLALFATLDGE